MVGVGEFEQFNGRAVFDDERDADAVGADDSPETVRPTCRKRSCWLSKESNACYGPKPRFMSQSG
jgi:hypothetical protein